MKQPGASQGPSASELISKRIAELGDWRGETLSKIRQLIHDADPDVVEEWKWMGTPIFSHDGIICTGESYKQVVKLTFAKGASLKDPARLFNSSLDGNVRRAIDIREGEPIDEFAFKALIRQAVDLNGSRPSKSAKTKTAPAKPTKSKPAAKAARPASKAKSASKAAQPASKAKSASKASKAAQPASKAKSASKASKAARPASKAKSTSKAAKTPAPSKPQK